VQLRLNPHPHAFLRPSVIAIDGSPDVSALVGRTVLVTGARGFLGRHVSRALCAIGATPVGLTRADAPRPGLHGCDRWIKGDLGDPSAIEHMIRSLQPDGVLHLAGFASGASTPDAVRNVVEGNVLSTANLMMAVQRHAPNARVIIAGSLESSDPMRGPTNFWTPYGASKAATEIIAHLLRDYGGLPVVSARIGTAYGHDDPNERRLVPHTILSLLDGVSPSLSSGDRLIDPIHIDDVVVALLGLLAAPGVPEGSVDVGTGRLRSIRVVADIIRSAVGASVPVNFHHVPDRAGNQVAADIQGMRSVLGWTPQVRLEEGIAQTVESYRAARSMRRASSHALN
jgi:UDP-glucose 4-epimerase